MSRLDDIFWGGAGVVFGVVRLEWTSDERSQVLPRWCRATIVCGVVLLPSTNAWGQLKGCTAYNAPGTTLRKKSH